MESEEIHLISKQSDGADYTHEHITDNLTIAEEKHLEYVPLNLRESAFVMLGVAMGSGILIMPFVIRQLGIAGWLVSFVLTVATYSIAAVLLGKSTTKVLDENESHSFVRDPYQLVAEHSCGKVMRRALIVFMDLTQLTCCMALLLISASILANLIPIPHLNHTDTIRVWSSVLVVLLTPITYLGTYSELRLPAFLAVSTALSSACLIVVNSLLYRFVYAKPDDFSQAKVQNADQIFFVPLGTVLFCTAGSFCVPNIVSVAASRSEIHKSFIGGYTCLFIVMGAAGIVPYLVFGDFVLSNTVSTFNSIINVSGRQFDDLTAFFVITVLIDVLMMLHLCTAIVLIMNPLFLHMEEVLGAPHEFTLKRVGIRTTCMVFCLTVCLIVPHFEPVLSLSGGIPFTFVGIIIPLLICVNLFPTPSYQKVLLYVFLLGLSALVVGNFVASIQLILEG